MELIKFVDGIKFFSEFSFGGLRELEAAVFVENADFFIPATFLVDAPTIIELLLSEGA